MTLGPVNRQVSRNSWLRLMRLSWAARRTTPFWMAALGITVRSLYTSLVQGMSLILRLAAWLNVCMAPLANIASALAVRGIGRIYVDGGATTQQFLRAGLIQRLIISRVPVLIGSGISLFGELERDVVLRHVATRNLANGLIQSEYEVAG